jgi:hypothetical protein
MKPPILIFVACGLALTATASASGPTTPEQKHLQPNVPRTVTISEADTPPVIRAGLLQSTLILLPNEEKVANVFAGDTVDWVFDGGHVASRFISVKPKVAGSTTDLHIRSPPTEAIQTQERQQVQSGSHSRQTSQKRTPRRSRKLPKLIHSGLGFSGAVLSPGQPLNRGGRTPFGFSRPSSRLTPAPARRLRGRRRSPFSTFPFNACGALRRVRARPQFFPTPIEGNPPFTRVFRSAPTHDISRSKPQFSEECTD